MKRPWLDANGNTFPYRKLIHVASLKARIGWQSLRTDEFVDEGPYCVTGTDFQNGRVNWSTSYHVSTERYEMDRNIQLDEGDLLVTKDGTIGKVAVVHGLDAPATLNSGVFVVRPKTNELSTDFLGWVVRSKVFDDFVAFNFSGSTINHLYQNVFETFRFPFPDLPTQRAIADFLDRETARIDLLIEKKQRLVALLGERKLGELTRRVTGRDDNRPKVFSGYDWIGDIPVDWQAKRLKFVTKKIVDGTHFTPTYVDDGVPFLRVTDISKGNRKIDWSSVSQISAEEHKALTRRISARKGDMLLSKNGTVGIPRVVDWDFEFSFFVSLCLIRPTDEINPNLLEMFFRSPIVIDQIDNGSRKTSVINLVMEKIRELVVLVPPKGEQEAIVQKCHEVFDYYNGVSERVEKSIDRLKEYRSALITAAVTGQIDVSTYAKSGATDRCLDAIQEEMGA